MPNRTVLILGGTLEAARLAERLSSGPGLRVITSLAGRTQSPAAIAGETRTGGFGGAEGLAMFLRDEKVDILVDATHPFASHISANAQEAAGIACIRRLVLMRPEWTSQAGERWQSVDSLEAAAIALPAGARAFLALGHQRLAAFSGRSDCHFVVRMIDEPSETLPLAAYDLVIGRPGTQPDAEAGLFRRHSVSHLVCRNSGGSGAYAKLDAARALALDVVMIRRPPPPAGEIVSTIDSLVAAIV